MTESEPTTSVFSRLERFAAVESTNDVVRGWLADGTPEVAVAVAREQTAGRGRAGRAWVAPPGAALLLSCGFRPSWLPPDRVWRLGAVVSLAMCDAAEEAAGLPEGAIRLKWPNDLVVELAGPHALLTGVVSADAAAARLAAPLDLRKVAGVLGETDGLGTADPRAVVGIGINADWAAADFPEALAGSMTSLREASAGRPIDTEALLAAFLGYLEARLDALRAGFFDVATWTSRQALAGRVVRLEGHGGSAREDATVDGVDASSGALVVTPLGSSEPRPVHAGEVVHVRLAPGV
ncbi:MAG: biotin--[acetyl-CoA-carboxylase] ligase [Candidatus Limnocylindrales bacterium]